MRALTDMTRLNAGQTAADRRRENPVEKNADAHHVEMRLRQIEKSPAVADMPEPDGKAAFLHLGSDFVETGDLEVGERLVHFVRLR